MHGLSDETKHKLMKALPWVLGAGVVLFLVLKLKGGSGGGGGAPVQDLSQLGGGNAAPVSQQPAVVPGDLAAQFGQQFASSHDRYAAMAANWAQQGNQNGIGGKYTGVTSKAWQQLTSGGWEDAFHPGHIISDSQAQDLGSSNHGPYAQGGGGFFGQVFGALGQVAGGFARSAAGIPPVSFGTPGIAASGRGQVPSATGVQVQSMPRQRQQGVS